MIVVSLIFLLILKVTQCERAGMEWHVSFLSSSLSKIYFGCMFHEYNVFLLLLLLGGISECLHKGRIKREKIIKGRTFSISILNL